MRVKAFGLIEAMIASFIAITVLSAAVALSSSVNKSTTIDSGYSVAERLADNYLENLGFANSQGKIFFDSRGHYIDGSGANQAYSINCFDTRFAQLCKSEFSVDSYEDFFTTLWNDSLAKFDNIDSYLIQSELVGNESFPNDFFKLKVIINNSPYKNASGASVCPSVSGLDIPTEKCRVVDIEVKWSENTGDNTYKVSRYFTDWTR